MINRKIFYLLSLLFSAFLFISTQSKAQGSEDLAEIKASTRGMEIYLRFYSDLPRSYFNSVITRAIDSLETDTVKKIHDSNTVILFAENEQDFRTMRFGDDPRNLKTIKVNTKNLQRWDAVKAHIEKAMK